MQIEVRKPTEEEIKMAESWHAWMSPPTEFPMSYGRTETCYILTGKAEITTKDGEVFNIQKGDWVVFPKGLECNWKITDGIDKKYNFS